MCIADSFTETLDTLCHVDDLQISQQGHKIVGVDISR